MWKSLLDSTEAALTAALDHASFPQSEEEQARNQNVGVGEATEDKTHAISKETTNIKDNEEDEIEQDNQNQKSTSSETDKAWYEENENEETPSVDNWFSLSSLTEALPGPLASVSSVLATNENNDSEEGRKQNTSIETGHQGEILDTLQSGWGMFQKVAQDQIMEAQRIFQDHMPDIPPPGLRDVSLNLDQETLEDAEVTYLTDRVIIMSHPMIQSQPPPHGNNSSPSQKLLAIAHLLQKRHANHYMVWNLSESSYDYSLLEDQVIYAPFSGSPCPTLGYLIRLILSIHSWLQSSPQNVAVFHCLTGKGRTATLLSCFLSWTGEAGFASPMDALEYIAICKQCSVHDLTIASQRRYISYFGKILEDGMRPKAAPVLLKRIILSKALPLDPPSGWENGDEGENVNLTEDELKSLTPLGCAPYMQLFKGGQLLYTTAATAPEGQLSKQLQDPESNLPFFLPSDGPISFPIDLEIQGDILFRCRHLSTSRNNEQKNENDNTASSSGTKMSMFRAAFHTGFVETQKVLRFTSSQLDGVPELTYEDPEEFFLDLIFDSYQGSINNNDTDDSAGKTKPPTLGSLKDDKSKNLAVLPSSYDSILHKESHFWDVVATRQMNPPRSYKDFDLETESNEKLTSLLSGPTIGRRRNFNSLGISTLDAKLSMDKKTLDDRSSLSGGGGTSGSFGFIDALSVSGHYDFELVDNESSTSTLSDEEQKRISRDKKGELIKILHEDDIVVVGKDGNMEEDFVEDEDEEIIFDATNTGEEGSSSKPSYQNDIQLDELDDLENFLNQM